MNTGKSHLLLRQNKTYAIKESESVTNTTVLSPENNPSMKIQINILNYFSEISTFYLLMDAPSLFIPCQLQIFCKTLGQV